MPKSLHIIILLTFAASLLAGCASAPRAQEVTVAPEVTQNTVAVDPLRGADTDRDGVPDYADKCPGSVDGQSISRNGCPIVIDRSISGVYFDVGSTILRPNSIAILGEVLEILKRYPEFQFALYGHADSCGNPRENQRLSQRRVDVVAKYLRERGITDRQLKAVRAYGDTKPLENTTGNCRSEWNRRVEFSEQLTTTVANTFMSNIAQHCYAAYEGRIVANEPKSATPDPFEGKKLIMHVRTCDDEDAEIRIPFHVGDDHSRTWVLTRTKTGLRLKHDHRHQDGTPDATTMYGGDTVNKGTATRQEFPVDAESIAMFKREGLNASLNNVWAIEIEPRKRFVYELARPNGRLFRVEFDLTKRVPIPVDPW